MTNVISASELKNNVSEILNEVTFMGNVAVIERYGKPIAKIIPIDKSLNLARLKKALDESFGSIPDFPDVTKDRRSRRRKIPVLFP